MSELDEKIQIWLGQHWHEFDDYLYCKCGALKADRYLRKNPAYSTDPAAMLDLIEAVKSKGYGIHLQFSQAVGRWEVSLVGIGNKYGHNDELPMAVALAVEKLIELESPDTRR